MIASTVLPQPHRLWRLPRPGRILQMTQARLRPPQLAHDAVEVILQAYDLQLARAPQNLPLGWRSHNAILHTDAGKKVLKQYGAHWPAATILHEHAILRQLARTGFPAPRLVLTPAQQSTVQHGAHTYALYDFIPGENVTGTFMLSQQRAQLFALAATTLARLHGQLWTYTPPAEHHLGFDAAGARRRDLAWHLQQLDALATQAGAITDPHARRDAQWLAAQATHIARRLQQLEEKTAALHLPQTIIHGDYGLHNLHLQRAATAIAAVMDFELARREWRLIDLIAVLSRIGLRHGQHFLKAYDDHCRLTADVPPLHEDEWTFLPDIWQLYRLRGAIQYWHNYTRLGNDGARRLHAARKRIEEAAWAVQHRPELWDLRPASNKRATSQPRPLRAMMVARLFYPWIGGAERQAQRLACTLQENDTSVTLSTGWWFRHTPRRETIDTIPVHRNFTFWHALDIKGLRKFSGYLYMLTLFLHLWRQRARYDLIHTHGLSYHTAVAVWAGRSFNKPVIVKLANSGPASDIRKMQQDSQLKFTRAMLPTALQAGCFVALNRLIVDELTAAGVPRHKIVEIPNGVDVAAFPAKQSYTLGQPPVLLFVGRLHPQKGLDTLLHALHRLRDLLPEQDVHLRLIGDGPARAALETITQQLSLDAHVTFAGASDDVVRELTTADLFVLPSHAEGLSNALLEAMSCALPVIASDLPGNRALIRPGSNGLLFPVDDSQALAICIYRLLQRATLRAQLGRAARQTVDQSYSLSHVAGCYSNQYRRLVNENMAQHGAPNQHEGDNHESR